MRTMGCRSFGFLSVKLANEPPRAATRRSTNRIPRCPASGEDSPLFPVQRDLSTFHIMPGSRLRLRRSSTCLVTSLQAWVPWRTGRKRKQHWRLRIPTMTDMDRTGFWNWLKCILEYILFVEFLPSRSYQNKTGFQMFSSQWSLWFRRHYYISGPCQVRDDLKRFLESMMSKSGKLRSLARDLRKSYSQDAAAMQPLWLKNMETSTKCVLHIYIYYLYSIWSTIMVSIGSIYFPKSHTPKLPNLIWPPLEPRLAAAAQVCASLGDKHQGSWCCVR